MDKLEIINDYVEGELPAEMEGELFSLLASDAEARTELKHLLAMKEAVKSDTKAFVPSVKSTNAIFAAIGMVPPAPIAEPTNISVFTKLKTFSAIHSKSIFSGLASAGLTAAAFILFFLPKSSDTNSFVDKKTNSTHTSTITAQAPPNIPITDSQAVSSSNIENNKPQVIYKYIVVEKSNSEQNPEKANAASSNDIQTNDDIASDNLQVNDQQIEQSTFDSKTNLNNLNQQNSQYVPVMELTSNDEIPNFEALTGYRKLHGFTVELKGSQYSSALKGSVKPSEKQAMNNTALSLLYDVSDDLAFGVDYSRENFYQKFEGREQDVRSERLYEYEQNPNFETFGLVCRYNPSFAKYDFAGLFSQLSLGGNKVGYVSRLMIGAELEPLRNYSLIIGYDLSSMYYSYQNKWYVSQKQGFQIGAAIKF